MLHEVQIDVLVPRLLPRNTLLPRLLPREIVTGGRSLRCSVFRCWSLGTSALIAVSGSSTNSVSGARVVDAIGLSGQGIACHRECSAATASAFVPEVTPATFSLKLIAVAQGHKRGVVLVHVND